MSRLRLLIKPSTFEILGIQKGQNNYIEYPEPKGRITKKALAQHSELVKSVKGALVYEIQGNPTLPDIVFVANGGFRLWGIPLVILPNMKYQQRKDELPYLKGILQDIGINTVEFPSSEPFEGQAEAKWFHGGKLLVCGYGHRSTKKSFKVLGEMLKTIYEANGVAAPKLLILPLESADYYHLDVAMLEFGDSCIIHKRAFSPASIRKLKAALGSSNVHIIDTKDSFCLNAVVQGDELLTHILKDDVKKQLEDITGLKVVQNDTSVFEKSGGSVRCMILDL
jgi:N-dimethylarginine dimethylaminohydrolase